MAACVTCAHPEREEIDAALVGGQSQRAVAARWGVSKDSVRRHAAAHLSPVLARLRADREETDARSAVERLESLYERASRVLDAAEKEGRGSAALAAVRELRGIVELLAKVTGELDERPTVTVNLATSPEWQELQRVILAALGSFPDARQAVAGALLAADVIRGEIEP